MESLTRVKRLEFDPGQKIICVYMRNEDSVTSLIILCFTLSHTSASHKRQREVLLPPG